MSTSDGDASSRLESALADVFAGGPDDWHVDDLADDEPTGPVALPPIVPATIDPAEHAQTATPAVTEPAPAMPTKKAAKAKTSAVSSILMLVDFPAPCPARVSMRISVGTSPA